MSNTGLEIQWDGGRARVLEIGAMLTDVDFELEDGRTINPLYKSPWLGEQLPQATPPLLKHLQGEWPCVPFGARSSAPLRDAWAGLPLQPEDVSAAWPHGYGANHAWSLSRSGPAQITAQIHYPEDSAIASLSRTVSGVSGQPAIELTLEIHVRRALRCPVGLHPVFRVPAEIGCLSLYTGNHGLVWNYPGDTGGESAFGGTYPAEDITELPTTANGTVDPYVLPYAQDSESILLLAQAAGKIVLENRREAYRATLTWEPEKLPSLLLWISNCGRKLSPWNGRNRALGIEPICAPFDLGQAFNGPDTPLAKSGSPTSVSLTPDSIWRTSYTLSLAAMTRT